MILSIGSCTRWLIVQLLPGIKIQVTLLKHQCSEPLSLFYCMRNNDLRRSNFDAWKAKDQEFFSQYKTDFSPDQRHSLKTVWWFLGMGCNMPHVPRNRTFVQHFAGTQLFVKLLSLSSVHDCPANKTVKQVNIPSRKGAISNPNQLHITLNVSNCLNAALPHNCSFTSFTLDCHF